MEKENRIKAPETEKMQEENASGKESPRKGLYSKGMSRYIRYVIFLVVIGLMYIWNSHRAENQVRKEKQLKEDIEMAKAQYKTMHARLDAGTRRPVVVSNADSLGLAITNKNIFKITREE